MKQKKKKIFLLFAGLFIFVILYLSTAFVWAYSVIFDIIENPEEHKLAAKNYEELEDKLLAVIVKVEDPGFYRHIGVDPFSKGQGLTTISSCLAKILFFDDKKLKGLPGNFQSFYIWFFRNFKKIDFGRDMMAIALNMRLSKQAQLNLFLDKVYWGTYKGRALYGLKDASLSYIGKDVRQLNKDEIIYLTAMLIGPDLYHPHKNPGIHHERIKRINRFLNGECTPGGLLDNELTACGTMKN